MRTVAVIILFAGAAAAQGAAPPKTYPCNTRAECKQLEREQKAEQQRLAATPQRKAFEKRLSQELVFAEISQLMIFKASAVSVYDAALQEVIARKGAAWMLLGENRDQSQISFLVKGRFGCVLEVEQFVNAEHTKLHVECHGGGDDYRYVFWQRSVFIPLFKGVARRLMAPMSGTATLPKP